MRVCDGVLIAAATDSSEPFVLAAAIARDRARISLVGVTGTEFSYRDFMQKELSLVVSRSYGPGRYDDDYEGRGMKYPVDPESAGIHFAFFGQAHLAPPRSDVFQT